MRRERPAKWTYPRQSLDRIAGRMHVRTPFEVVLAELQAYVDKMPKWKQKFFTPPRVRRCAIYIKAWHNRHIRDMREMNIFL